MDTGVYTITNKINGKIYVGSSRTSMIRRKHRHDYYFRHGNHPNKLLCKAAQEFGIDNLIFEVLEECAPEFCYDMEQYWMNTLQSYNPIYGYNVLPTARNSTGLRQSGEARLKMRKSKNTV